MKHIYKRILALILAFATAASMAALTPARTAPRQEDDWDITPPEVPQVERTAPQEMNAELRSISAMQLVTLDSGVQAATLDSGMPPLTGVRSAAGNVFVADPADVAAMNEIIVKNKLPGITPWTGGACPKAWDEYVQWGTTDGQNARIAILTLSNKKVSGTLDVSKLTALDRLICKGAKVEKWSSNWPKSLDVLDVSNSELTVLPSLPQSLQTLNCDNNQLQALPALPPNLKLLNCKWNWLKELPPLPDSLTILYCGYNQLTLLPELPPLMEDFRCEGNLIKKIPSLPETVKILTIGETLITELPTLPQGLTHLECGGFGGEQERRMALTTMPELPEGLIWLNCQYWTNLKALPKLPEGLTTLACGGNPLKVLPELPQSLEYLWCDNIGLEKLPSLPGTLTTLNCSDNPLGNLNLSQTPNLETLGCYATGLKELNLSDTPNLEKLICSGNKLTELDVSKTPKLTKLGCDMNQLTALDLSGLPNLEEVFLYRNRITKLDVSNKPYLKELHCQMNLLTELNISNTPNLEILFCFSNRLTSLDISGSPNLMRLYCTYNRFRSKADVKGLEQSGFKEEGSDFYFSPQGRSDYEDEIGGGSSGGSGGSSGGGGTPSSDRIPMKWDTPATGTAPAGSVNSAEAIKQTTEAVVAALKNGGKAPASVFVQNVGAVSAQTLRDMAAAAKKAGGTVRLVADTVTDGKTVARLYLDTAQAAKLTADIQLGVSVSGAGPAATMARFQKYYTNKVCVISMAQQGSFGMPVNVAVKADLTGLDVKNIRFYSYDKATNRVTLIPAPNYRIDQNGFLHFTTSLGGDIIITDKALTGK